MSVQWVAVLLGAAFLLSCSGVRDDDTYPPSHVLLVYMGAGNNLQTAAHAKLNAIRDGWSGRAEHRIVVYFDCKGAAAELKEIRFDRDGRKTAATKAVYNHENSASAGTLSRVIADVRAAYPADRYGLLVFSHASGWLPAGALAAPDLSANAPRARSVIADDAFGEMELRDFAAAIPDGVFDYVVFETCFMSGIEAAYELRVKTPVILASSAEIVDPGFTPVYASSIAELMTGGAAAFARAAFARILAYDENALERSSTLSVIRTSGLEPLAEFIGRNCDLDRDVQIDRIQRFDRNEYRLFFDFGDYYARLLDSDGQRAELSRLIDGCIAWRAATPQFMTQSSGWNGYAIDRHSGLTAYIPQPRFPALNAEYENLSWTKKIRSFPKNNL